MAIEWAVVGNGIFSLIAAGFAYQAAVRKHDETTKDSDKGIYVAAVTNERAKWREELRRSVAEFCMLSVERPPNIPKLHQVKAEILLRLNPRCNDPEYAEMHKFDRDISDSVKAIVTLASARNRDSIATILNKLEVSTQELLKQEWEKSKTEALHGRSKYGQH